MDTAIYFATDPKPGQLSVIGRSLSMVFGTPMHWTGKPIFFSDLRDLVRRIRGITTPVIEEITDIVSTQNFDEPLVFPLALLNALELVPAGAKRAAGCVTQSTDACLAFPGCIDQLLFKHTIVSVPAGINLADFFAVVPCGLDDAAGSGVDHRRHTT